MYFEFQIMDSVGSECKDLKEEYDHCFNKWFSERFLKGSTEENEECTKIFHIYQSCVKVSL